MFLPSFLSCEMHISARVCYGPEKGISAKLIVILHKKEYVLVYHLMACCHMG